jgi:hypothetical protein
VGVLPCADWHESESSSSNSESGEGRGVQGRARPADGYVFNRRKVVSFSEEDRDQGGLGVQGFVAPVSSSSVRDGRRG